VLGGGGMASGRGAGALCWLPDLSVRRLTDPYLQHTVKGARAQKIGLKSTYLKISFR